MEIVKPDLDKWHEQHPTREFGDFLQNFNPFKNTNAASPDDGWKPLDIIAFFIHGDQYRPGYDFNSMSILIKVSIARIHAERGRGCHQWQDLAHARSILSDAVTTIERKWTGTRMQQRASASYWSFHGSNPHGPHCYRALQPSTLEYEAMSQKKFLVPPLPLRTMDALPSLFPDCKFQITFPCFTSTDGEDEVSEDEFGVWHNQPNQQMCYSERAINSINANIANFTADDPTSPDSITPADGIDVDNIAYVTTLGRAFPADAHGTSSDIIEFAYFYLPNFKEANTPYPEIPKTIMFSFNGYDYYVRRDQRDIFVETYNEVRNELGSTAPQWEKNKQRQKFLSRKTKMAVVEFTRIIHSNVTLASLYVFVEACGMRATNVTDIITHAYQTATVETDFQWAAAMTLPCPLDMVRVDPTKKNKAKSETMVYYTIHPSDKDNATSLCGYTAITEYDDYFPFSFTSSEFSTFTFKHDNRTHPDPTVLCPVTQVVLYPGQVHVMKLMVPSEERREVPRHKQRCFQKLQRWIEILDNIADPDTSPHLQTTDNNGCRVEITFRCTVGNHMPDVVREMRVAFSQIHRSVYHQNYRHVIIPVRDIATSFKRTLAVVHDSYRCFHYHQTHMSRMLTTRTEYIITQLLSKQTGLFMRLANGAPKYFLDDDGRLFMNPFYKKPKPPGRFIYRNDVPEEDTSTTTGQPLNSNEADQNAPRNQRPVTSTSVNFADHWNDMDERLHFVNTRRGLFEARAITGHKIRGSQAQPTKRALCEYIFNKYG